MPHRQRHRREGCDVSASVALAMSLKPLIEQRITETLKPTHLEVQDDSDMHKGHKGSGGGGHYLATVISEAFEGRSRVERHQMVYALFQEELRSGVMHALALTTKTPSEWKG